MYKVIVYDKTATVPYFGIIEEKTFKKFKKAEKYYNQRNSFFKKHDIFTFCAKIRKIV